MPARNIIKEYTGDGVYHVYNRGVEKRNIFLDQKDYKVFLHYLKIYLADPKTLQGLHPGKLFLGNRKNNERKNFFCRIELLAYCLMPNHFHLLIKQKGEKDIAEFMKCLGTNYSMYFNHRYDRVGSLFQGTYKGALVREDNYLVHLSKYIHLNPQGLHPGRLWEYDYSSFAEYLGKRDTVWIKPKFVLGFFENSIDKTFSKHKSYQSFVEDKEEGLEIILGRMAID